MLIETEELRELAPTLQSLGESLNRLSSSQEGIDLAGELIETACTFRSLPADDYLDSADYEGERARQFADNFLHLAMIAKAGASEAHRGSPLLKEVGLAADTEKLGNKCQNVASVLTPIVRELL